VPGTGIRLPLRRTDRTDSSLYEGDLPLDRLELGRTYPVAVVLEAASSAGMRPLETPLPASVAVKRPSDYPLVRVKNPQSILTYNLGPIRLGGPIIAEYEPGVLLQVDGRAGEALRVRLNRTQSGFIHQNDVEEAPAGTPAPQFFIQSASAGPENQADVVRIPYPEPVPYAVFPEPELGRIRIALYGVKTSSTWITHRQGLQVVERVDWQQSAADTYEVMVYLKTPDIWGYTFEQGRSSLALRVKHPPVFAGDADRPLAGLKVAIEAGHGGSNVGATGLSGMPEKDLNLAVALEVERICRERGMEVLQVRPDDRDMALEEKRRAIEASDADLAVSIHANSASTERGYLGASGTSTYYHNPFWAPFARDVYDALLELPLGEFGVVGSFNYRVTRMSSRPAILVEQAFMSHAEDEEKLASPEFRTAMAEKVVEGMERYVRRLRR
jgi:N-acetylmuramoyl-L-alanine amidase